MKRNDENGTSIEMFPHLYSFDNWVSIWWSRKWKYRRL